MTAAPPDPVAAVFARYPGDARDRLLAVRQMILDEAARLSVGPLTETLKWGEPAYLTEASRPGTTIRLAWSPKSPEICRLLVNCRTSLVDSFRDRFADTLRFEGDRAICLPLSQPLPDLPLRHCIALALTYRKRRA